MRTPSSPVVAGADLDRRPQRAQPRAGPGADLHQPRPLLVDPVNAAVASDRPDNPAVAISPTGSDLYLVYDAFLRPFQTTTANPWRMQGGRRPGSVDLASSAGSRLTSSGSSTSHKVRPACGSVSRSTAHLQDLEVTAVSFNHDPARGHRAFAQLTGYFSRDLLRGK